VVVERPRSDSRRGIIMPASVARLTPTRGPVKRRGKLAPVGNPAAGLLDEGRGCVEEGDDGFDVLPGGGDAGLGSGQVRFDGCGVGQSCIQTAGNAGGELGDSDPFQRPA
jgi:hypothetical protein